MRTLLVAVLAGVTLSAQTSTPGFEVAAIRENTGGSTGGGTRFQDGGRWSATNMPLASLITVAFGLNDSDRVLNVPAWARATRYDINAIGMPGFANEHVPAAILALLRERFGLVAHLETREFPVYNLTLLRADGRLGPNLRPAAVNCLDLAVRRAAIAAAPTGIPCGIRWSDGGTLIEAGGVNAETLANLMGASGRQVVDKTGLTGLFDMTLRHGGRGPEPIGDAPSIFTAVQEQLGLKLEGGTAALDVVIVDNVTRPTPN
jgi:uncharacterized protein (TIGR03435 family)